MAEFRAITEATLQRKLNRSERQPSPRAISARFDRRTHRVVVALDTGLDLRFDPRRVKGLEAAAGDDLMGVSVEGVGSTLHFPRLDADYTVSRLLEGFLGPLDWTKRERRASTSRENGKRGGRPKRETDAVVESGGPG